MDSTESVNFYIRLVEHIADDGSTLEDILKETFPASSFDRAWTVVINTQLDSEQEIDDEPAPGMTVTVQPNQALIYLGEDHAGILGPGAGEFYDSRFNVEDGTLKDEFMRDFTSEIIE